MSGNRPIVIKKVKKVIGGGHHGGAWKVAYADFVTAMMAFFLLMWLINTTSPEQKRGIADYFAPASVSRSTQGSDGLLGGTAFQEDGARASGSNRQIDEELSAENERTKSGSPEKTTTQAGVPSESALAQALSKRESAKFASAEASLRQALQDLPDYAELSKNIIIEQNDDGLNIQLVDQEGRAMFSGSSADPLPRTQHLLDTVSKVIQQLPNRISISGHTDTTAPSRPGYSNWDLSADRANAARRILEISGVEADRIYQVAGKGDREPLYPDDPDLPANRRISITLMPEAPVMPSEHDL
ncbi:MAG: flagellar motor protein MotB [Hyphomonadaceae bacterium]